MSAVCVRCGLGKPSFDAVCPSCGHRPEGDGLLVAWLLSEQNLDATALQATSARIVAGEPIRPSRKMLKKAQRALGRQISTDPGLSVRELGLLLAGDIVFTPLIGWTCVAFWFGERPRAALQAGLVTLPTSVAFTALWGWYAFGGVA